MVIRYRQLERIAAGRHSAPEELSGFTFDAAAAETGLQSLRAACRRRGSSGWPPAVTPAPVMRKRVKGWPAAGRRKRAGKIP